MERKGTMKAPVNIIKKICLIGDPSVGKTSLIQRYVFDTFREDYQPTIGTKVVKKTLLMDFEPKRPQQVNLTMLIFDLLGQVQFVKVHKTYYMGSEGAMIIGDLSRDDTLLSMIEWHKRFREVVGDVPVIYIGNKEDLAKDMQENKDLLAEISSDSDSTYLYTSAKTGGNVERAFTLLATQILQYSPI